MLIIGIAGGTGSGKTTVVKKIIESLPPGEVVLLPQDSRRQRQMCIRDSLRASHLAERGEMHRAAHLFLSYLLPIARDHSYRAS